MKPLCEYAANLKQFSAKIMTVLIFLKTIVICIQCVRVDGVKFVRVRRLVGVFIVMYVGLSVCFCSLVY